MPFFLISTGGPSGLAQALMIGLSISVVLGLFVCISHAPLTGRASALARAFYVYTLQGIGVLLMTVSGLPAMYGVLMGLTLPRNGYLGLLIIFLLGGFLFLRYENKARFLDIQARELPAILFRYTFRLIGFTTVILGLLQLLITVLYARSPFTGTWWFGPGLLVAYGAFLSWTTHDPGKKAPVIQFQSAPMKKTATITVGKAKVTGRRK